MSKEMRGYIDNFKNFLLKENKLSEVEKIIETIDSNPKKIKIQKPYTIYDDGLVTAISNSEITKFYSKYQRENNKKYIKSIPFPFEKFNDNKDRFNKLNDICKIFENYSELKMSLVKNLSLHLMDIILFDMYFNIKSRKYDVYEIVDSLVIPDKNNGEECEEFGLWFINKENPINYILFFSNSNEIIMTIKEFN